MRNLLLIALLGVFAVVLVLAGCRNNAKQEPTAAPRQQAATPQPTVDAETHAAGKIADDEAVCPVMGEVMKKSQMTPVKHDGKTYYMCCSECIGKFTADPEKYIGNAAGMTKEDAGHHQHH